MPEDRSNPNDLFRDRPEQRLKPRPRDSFWDCINFATDDCEGDCICCDVPMDEIDLLCEAKW